MAESKAATPSCWTIRTPTDTRPILGGGGGVKWMAAEVEWKVRATEREIRIRGNDGSLSLALELQTNLDQI